VNGVGVRAGAPAGGLGRALDALGRGHLVQQVVHRAADDRAARDHRAAAEPVVAELAGVDPGRIGRVGHVDHHGEIGLQPVGHHARAVGADLLLHGRHAGDRAGRAARLLHAPRHLDGDEHAEPVVERSRRQAPVGQLERLGGDEDLVAGRDQ
jgi:hypothetical protein